MAGPISVHYGGGVFNAGLWRRKRDMIGQCDNVFWANPALFGLFTRSWMTMDWMCSSDDNINWSCDTMCHVCVLVKVFPRHFNDRPLRGYIWKSTSSKHQSLLAIFGAPPPPPHPPWVTCHHLLAMWGHVCLLLYLLEVGENKIFRYLHISTGTGQEESFRIAGSEKQLLRCRRALSMVTRRLTLSSASCFNWAILCIDFAVRFTLIILIWCH